MVVNFETKEIRKETFLYSLLKSWHKTLEDYEKSEKDLGYDYRERTNIGFLAAAATKKRCIVLEEYMCDKKRGHREISGRADLLIIVPNNNRYQFEAKRIELNVSSEDFDKKVKDTLNSALGDIKKITKKYREGKPAGIVFVIPKIPKGWEDSLKNLKDKLLDLKSLNADFSAVHFCQDIPPSKQSPCVAVVGKWYKEGEKLVN